VGDLVSLSYLGILGSAIAYVWYYQGVSQLGAAGAGSFIALNPLSAVIIGTIFLNEKMSSMIILGVGCLFIKFYFSMVYKLYPRHAQLY